MVQTRSSRRQTLSGAESTGLPDSDSESVATATTITTPKTSKRKAAPKKSAAKRKKSENTQAGKKSAGEGRRRKRQQSLQEVSPVGNEKKTDKDAEREEGKQDESEGKESDTEEKVRVKGKRIAKQEKPDEGKEWGQQIKKVKTKAEEPPASGIEIDSERKEKETKTPILEKGILYFFIRPRVNIEDPRSLEEVQRAYIVLLPLPEGAKLSEAPVKAKDARYRLLILPKKRLPSTEKHERFLAFVEKPSSTLEDLKATFLTSKTYTTKTGGERVVPEPRPVGEGVYAITRRENDRSSHLAYILTIPDIPNDLQKQFGLKDRGSYVISVRNPQMLPPPGVSIPPLAKFPKEIFEEFRDRRWIPAEPKYFQYQNAEILFIGERGDIASVADEFGKEVFEEFGGDEQARTKALEGNDPVFHDLELDKKESPSLLGTWIKVEDEEEGEGGGGEEEEEEREDRKEKEKEVEQR